jgi:hypothetical protein
VAPDVTSAHGDVRGRELLAGLGVGYALTPRGATWGGDVVVRGDVVDVQFSGIAGPGVRSVSNSAIGATVSGALGGWLRLNELLRIVGDVAVGLPIRGVAAQDEGQRTTGLSGVSFGGALGLAAVFPTD